MEIRLTSGKTLSILQGESLYHALKRQGIYLVSSCGGKGSCGKCKIKIIKGGYEALSFGKLGQKDRESGFVIACQTFPRDDVLIEIPRESRIVVGDKIAVSKTRDLFELFESFEVRISPVVKRLSLDLPPPTIHDNISDVERLKRSLEKSGMKGVRFSHIFVSSLSGALRKAEWKIVL